MRVLPIVLVLFLVALIAPRKSRRLQRWIQTRLEKGKKKGHRNAGFVGEWTAKSLHFGQRLVDAAMSGGRRLRGRLPV
jgi:hypothetical protein